MTMYKMLKDLLCGRKIVYCENEDGELVTVQTVDDEIISEEPAIKTETLQTNGWIRINIYYADHTVEELYQRPAE